MKLVPVTDYKIVNDDGSEVRPATAQKVKDIVELMQTAKVLGDSSPVNNNVAMRIASAILNNYELRKKRPSTKQETDATAIDSIEPVCQMVEDPATFENFKKVKAMTDELEKEQRKLDATNPKSSIDPKSGKTYDQLEKELRDANPQMPYEADLDALEKTNG